jgi:hypothetical protein
VPVGSSDGGESSRGTELEKVRFDLSYARKRLAGNSRPRSEQVAWAMQRRAYLKVEQLPHRVPVISGSIAVRFAKPRVA